MQRGKVEIDCLSGKQIIEVDYRFVNENTIFCIEVNNTENVFYTHYKSLVVTA